MATTDKDFRVKNGIQVAGAAVIGGTITAADPTSDSHVMTLGYFNANNTAGSLPVASTAPESPEEGDTYIDSITKRINIYIAGQWITMAAVDDTQNLPQHIHDTSIDGSGLIVSTFTEGGSITSPQSSPVDGGGVSTTSWDALLDGGSATDNFN